MHLHAKAGLRKQKRQLRKESEVYKLSYRQIFRTVIPKNRRQINKI